LDITPLVPPGRQIVEAYGAGRFRIAGVVHDGSVLVFPRRTLPWPVARFDQVTAASLVSVTDSEAAVELLLLGTGARMAPVPAELRGTLRAAGIALEAMDTGAACRTYNVLMAEDRRIAAALIAVD
jgi:uncharacterized protein